MSLKLAVVTLAPLNLHGKKMSPELAVATLAPINLHGTKMSLEHALVAIAPSTSTEQKCRWSTLW